MVRRPSHTASVHEPLNQPIKQVESTTPKGLPISMLIRKHTNDWNVIVSILLHDEYDLRSLEPAFEEPAWAIDLGSHLGTLAIALALEHPELHVVAVEPVPDNLELIRRNAVLNGVDDRLTVLAAATGPAGLKTRVRYGFRGVPEAEHHAWIGNATLVYSDAPPIEFDEVTVTCLDLRQLVIAAVCPPCFVKVDVEGGEWGALPQLVALGCPLVVGEWHPVLGRERADELVEAFTAAGYSVELDGPEGGPGLFTARLPILLA